jgi:hypothetical protein
VDEEELTSKHSSVEASELDP